MMIMKKKQLLKISILFAIVFTLISSDTLSGISFAAENTDAGYELHEAAKIDLNSTSYSNYLNKYKDVSYPDVFVTLGSKNCLTEQTENVKILPDFNGVQNVIRVTGEDTSVKWRFNIEQEGFYDISMSYFSLESKNPMIEFSLYIDGERPFDEAGNITLKRAWKDQNRIQSDSRGNNLRPNQVLAPVWLKDYFKDPEGLYNDNLHFYFSRGNHVLEIAASRADFIIGNIEIANEKQLPLYKEVKGSYDKITDTDTPDIIVQGENATLKSDSTLYPIYDRSDMATSPSDPIKLILNTIGGYNWKDSGQWISWNFNVPENGYYKISMRARQNLANGRISNRRVYIDGEVMFSELNDVKFPFSNNWYIKTLGDDDPFVFYFTKGSHNIRMEAIPGEVGEIYNSLLQCVYTMNETYRQIVMITGTTPDPYRDYKIQKDIPSLLDTFANIRDTLISQKDYMESISGEGGDSSGIMESLIVQLDSFIKKPDTIPLRLDSYKANISSLSSWMMVVKEQPLEIDYMDVSPVNRKVTEKRYNIFQRLLFSIKSLIGSFGVDYRMVGDFYNEKDALTVWVGMGRDQVQIVKDLVDSDFVKKTGIKVNINLVQQGLIEATLAGKGPDIALFVGSSDPVNLAARGALVDLTQFNDFGDISKRFMSEALVPFGYEGGYFALPATQSFPMMFYRKDLFAELGIQPPKTWNDVYRIAPIIQRKNLNLGIGGNAGTMGVDIGTFATLLFQKGGMFYNDKRTKTELNSDEGLSAFTQWTDFYTKYSLPLQYDFQNRFRTGEMPIGIAPYTLYNFLEVAAPEIKNLWGMLPVPGTVYEDGTVDNSVCGGSQVQGSIIFKKVKDKDAAWEFLKWFTNSDIQSRLGMELEIQMGPSARYPTANVEALKYLPWKKAELNMLYDQWKKIKEIPEIPASYYISRNITNAFRKVTYQYENPWHTLNQYNYEMNKEITRKRLELDLPVD